MVPADSIAAIERAFLERATFRELLREALPFVETYEDGDILTEGMSRAAYDNLVMRIRIALDPFNVMVEPSEGAAPGPDIKARKGTKIAWGSFAYLQAKKAKP